MTVFGDDIFLFFPFSLATLFYPSLGSWSDERSLPPFRHNLSMKWRYPVLGQPRGLVPSEAYSIVFSGLGVPPFVEHGQTS